MIRLNLYTTEELKQLRADLDFEIDRRFEYRHRPDEETIRRWVMLAKLWTLEGYTGQNSTDPDSSYRYIQDAAQSPSYIQDSMELPASTYKHREVFWKALDRYHAQWKLKKENR